MRSCDMEKMPKSTEIKTQAVSMSLDLTAEYKALLQGLKEKILSSRLKAAQAVNQHVIELYWHIGKQIIKKQEGTDWGHGLIERLSNDLRHTFPETRGFSPTSLKKDAYVC